jgi:hypothetical protein
MKPLWVMSSAIIIYSILITFHYIFKVHIHINIPTSPHINPNCLPILWFFTLFSFHQFLLLFMHFLLLTWQLCLLDDSVVWGDSYIEYLGFCDSLHLGGLWFTGACGCCIFPLAKLGATHAFIVVSLIK